MSSQSSVPGRPRVFVDMDGVIVNFNKAVAPLLGLEYPTEPSVLGHYWSFEEYERKWSKTLSHPEFIDVLRGRDELWSDMEFYWWAKRIIIQLTARQADWYILTHCVDDPWCPYGKHWALTKHFGSEIVKRTFMTFGTKHQMCRPGDVLIDDAEKNCVAWRQAGGVAFNWVDYTESHPQAGPQVEELFRFLGEHNCLGL